MLWRFCLLFLADKYTVFPFLNKPCLHNMKQLSLLFSKAVCFRDKCIGVGLDWFTLRPNVTEIILGDQGGKIKKC